MNYICLITLFCVVCINASVINSISEDTDTQISNLSNELSGLIIC